jgi:hypothetical protein
MADLQHLIGSDLSITANGNIVMSYDEAEGQERVLRRLLSNPGSYYWHPNYGAGLARFLGKPLITARIKSTIQTQMRLEQAVLQNPSPSVTVSTYNGDTVMANILYVDATTNLTSQLTVPIEGF